MPSRVRGDRGGENLQVTTHLVATNGHNRGSFLWGSSTRNSRIERLWVEVGTQFARRWRGFFTRLERLHKLDIDKPGHLWLLSVLFSSALDDDCRQFQREWNSHPICGSETNNRSPQDMRLLGQALLGIYEDEFEGIHPATLQRYYGIDRRETIRHLNQTGAGHPNDELENEEDGVIDRIERDQANDVLHDAIEVPDGNTPFLNEEDENVFFGILDEVITEGIIPVGYNLQEGEDDYDENTTEHLRVGRRREIYVEVSLADPIWRTRSMLWAQAVSVLEHFEADVFF
ncbi:uncharacterized protein HD556DRAFT_1243401 [Suillus plorans]|uniref:Integrase core domain-containing protein n=1 Tax=Suillus plorans TaxID=116603 RepID=A0A9P7DE42_9AGAM|nr:uncharacterized protein HD556DRAFT_1243401 [Suillus plorans]KAG1789767.1 hypothetical protein HD556DRAFT_1243401 [Suillus plorans]